MHIGIIGAMDEEIELIKQRIEGLTEDQYLGYTFYNGMYGQHTVTYGRYAYSLPFTR